MINSKLSKKSLKKRSLKLKNKRTKKSKVSRKNVRKMKGGETPIEIFAQMLKNFSNDETQTIINKQTFERSVEIGECCYDYIRANRETHELNEERRDEIERNKDNCTTIMVLILRRLSFLYNKLNRSTYPSAANGANGASGANG